MRNPKGQDHPRWKHGGSENYRMSPEYVAWNGMKIRCRRDPNWGGRGITFCDRWKEFANFLEDMGPKPAAHYTLGRIDNNGNYEPDNCRWETRAEQGQNRRGLRLTMTDARKIRLLYDQGYSASSLAERFKTHVRTVYDVIWGKTWKEEPTDLENY